MKTKAIFAAIGIIVLGSLNIFAGEPVTNVFPTYRDCFRFMAGCQETTVVDEANLFKLAAESSMETFRLADGTSNIVLVIKLDYLKGPYSAMRGAQGNGLYFLFVPRSNGFEHVGTMAGNAYRHGTLNGRCRFITSWHMSGAEAIETEYVWNGKMFEVTKKALYRFGPSKGQRELLKDYLMGKGSEETEASVTPLPRGGGGHPEGEH